MKYYFAEEKNILVAFTKDILLSIFKSTLTKIKVAYLVQNLMLFLLVILKEFCAFFSYTKVYDFLMTFIHNMKFQAILCSTLYQHIRLILPYLEHIRNGMRRISL